LHDAGLGRAACISRAADALLLPLCGETWRDLDAPQTPSLIAGPELHGAGLEASTVTMAQRADGIIVRAVNLTTDTVQGYWMLPHDGPWVVTRVRLDESPLAPPTQSGARINFEAGPRAIVSLHVARAT
jgi:hypothetical protein